MCNRQSKEKKKTHPKFYWWDYWFEAVKEYFAHKIRILITRQ